MDLLAAMQVFVRVVERRSLSEAARDLGIGQSSISERISRLEEHLGVQLLHRNSRAVQPSDLGLIFYERSKKALAAADFAQGVSQGNDERLTGTVRIAAPHGLGEMVLPSILMRFKEAHPQVAIDLILNDRIVSPETEGVDVSIRLGDADEKNCISERIGFVHRVLAGAPDISMTSIVQGTIAMSRSSFYWYTFLDVMRIP